MDTVLFKEVGMTGKVFVGVDPDSTGCEFYQLDATQTASRWFAMDYASLKECTTWLKKLGDVLVGIEGKGNFSQPLEVALQSEGIPYLNFPADKIYHYRKSMIGDNKNNVNDAKTTALYLKTIYNGDLAKPEYAYELNTSLRELSREFSIKRKQETFLKNQLWKKIRRCSQDLYLWLSGKGEEIRAHKRADILCLLKLIAQKPDLASWKNMTSNEFIAISGSGKFKNWETIFHGLITSTSHISPLQPHLQLLLKQTAQDLIQLRSQLQELEKALELEATDNVPVQSLCKIRGIGIRLAASFVAEIADINRFANNNKLASYAGYGRREYSTGQTNRMIRSNRFNHNLKSTVTQMAIHYVQWNPDSVLGRYGRALIKKGMKKIEAYKRVGRALIRQFFRIMKADSNINGKVNMANQLIGYDQNDHNGNMRPSLISA